MQAFGMESTYRFVLKQRRANLNHIVQRTAYSVEVVEHEQFR